LQYKRDRKLPGQSRINNSEILVTLCIQNTGRRQREKNQKQNKTETKNKKNKTNKQTNQSTAQQRKLTM